MKRVGCERDESQDELLEDERILDLHSWHGIQFVPSSFPRLAERIPGTFLSLSFNLVSKKGHEWFFLAVLSKLISIWGQRGRE